MTQQMIKDGNPGKIDFRGVEGENDYPLLLAIIRSSRQADKTPMETTRKILSNPMPPRPNLTRLEKQLLLFWPAAMRQSAAAGWLVFEQSGHASVLSNQLFDASLSRARALASHSAPKRAALERNCRETSHRGSTLLSGLGIR